MTAISSPITQKSQYNNNANVYAPIYGPFAKIIHHWIPLTDTGHAESVSTLSYEWYEQTPLFNKTLSWSWQAVLKIVYQVFFSISIQNYVITAPIHTYTWKYFNNRNHSQSWKRQQLIRYDMLIFIQQRDRDPWLGLWGPNLFQNIISFLAR